MVLSPITRKQNVAFERRIETAEIIEGYRNTLGLDVGRYLRGLEYVEVYKCLDTHYRFYYPFDIAGDGAFYDQLQQKHHWYYCDWKWEYKVVQDLIGGSGQLLEIGCGKGAFLEAIQKTGTACIGLELSEDAIREGNRKGLDIRNQTIEAFAPLHPGRFDVVCSFQLLEHVTQVDSLIRASLAALRKGGRMVMAVPNNDTLCFRHGKSRIDNQDHLYQPTRLLNLPPHHMGLWNAESLSKLPEVYGMELETILREPLNAHRKQLHANIVAERLGVASRFVYQMAPARKTWLLQRLFPGEFRHGDTIIAVFKKR